MRSLFDPAEKAQDLKKQALLPHRWRHRRRKRGRSCHGGTIWAGTGNLPKLFLVGNPNVGKSVLFNRLTGLYVTVSNYPGTTVEISRGQACISGRSYEVVDTPGMYSLLPITEEERVTRSLLLSERPDAVLHVVDAKNLERMLPLTIQLIEAGLPVILVVNIMDEAEELGLRIETERLAQRLGIPVIGAVSTTGRGLDELKRAISSFSATAPSPPQPLRYDPALEEAIEKLQSALRGAYSLSRRTVALLLLQEDEEIWDLVKAKEGANFPLLRDLFRQLRQRQSAPFSYLLSLERQRLAQQLLQQVVRSGGPRRRGRTGEWAEALSRLTMRPLTGIPILLLVLYGLYQFVGVFGAGTAVDFLEEAVFGRYLLPPTTRLVQALLPWPTWQQLFIGEYGIITLGVRYALAIILPIVGTFFLFFSLLEDSGYFPRLAMLVDGLFKKIGLNGRAVIPLVLGFGCDTMATITTRILETRRERIIATLLLALAIPCSAQLGVILALLSAHPAALAVWASIVAFAFLLVGYLSAQVLPGERPSFYMELPPLRVPVLENVLAKTAARMQWYFLEVFPIFILVSVLIWLGQLTGVFSLLIRLVQPAMHLLGLPPQTAVAFLFGFFRRDYGAAGLFDLHKAGVLTPGQLLIASVTLTLFVPCIAQFSIMARERGAKTALVIFLFALFFAVGMGYGVRLLLEYSGVSL